MAQINLDLTQPTNAIRAVVGDIDACDPVMSDTMYQQIYDTNNINDRDECAVLWFSAIQAAEIIMSHYAHTGQRSRERVNAVEVENYGGERYKNFQDLVKWLRNNPPKGCGSGFPLFHFGGTYNEYNKLYTLRYIQDVVSTRYPNVWVDGYYLFIESED